MTAFTLSSPEPRFSRPVVATIRRERSAWRAEFSPVKPRMLETMPSIGYSWLNASDLRVRATTR